MTRVVLALNTDSLVTRVDLMSGMMQALVSTAAGLVVAVSVQVMYSMLHIRLERLVVDLEAAASEILALLSPHREVAG